MSAPAPTDPSPPGRAPAVDSEGRDLQPSGLCVGDRIGVYVVDALLGAGGMGEVYRATDTRLERTVAIKILRSALSVDTARWLLLEAQAMAKLSHENVVTVFEVAEDGARVYAVMEFVDGQTLRAWLAERPRPWRDVTETFIAAGRGLGAAHAAGLVHRDFKLDNVLVGKDGRVRVTDFGLAGQAGADAAGGDYGAVLGEFDTVRYSELAMGTPAYMSPEQHLRQTLDARSDQFAFCVSLWEALYGTRPFEGRTYTELRANVAAGRLIPPPAGADVPAWIRPVLLRGLSVSRADRFPSMADLALALGRDPAVRRRRVVAGAAMLAAAVGLFVAARGTVSAPAPCTGAAARLAGAWNPTVRGAIQQAFLATGRSYAADAFTATAAKLDAYAAAWTAMHVEACAATVERHEQSGALLDKRMECLDRRLGELRAFTALLARSPDGAVVGRADSAASRLDDVKACADVSALGAAEPLPADPERRTAIAAAYARLAEAHVLGLAGKARPALGDLAPHLPGISALAYAPLEIETLNLLVKIYGILRQTPSQEAVLRSYIVAVTRAHDTQHTARAWTDLITVVGAIDHRYDEALAMRTAVEAAIAAAGGGDALRATLLSALGRVLSSKGDVRAAEPMLRQSIALFGAPPPGTDEITLAATENELGGVLLTTGRAAEAAEAYRRAVAIYERFYGPAHVFVAGMWLNLASTLQVRGRLDEALELMERAVGRFEAIEGAEGPDVSDGLTSLGGLLIDRGDCAAALPRFERAVAIKTKVRGPDDVEMAEPVLGVGRAQLGLGRLDDAAAAIERARGLYEQAEGPDGPRHAAALAARAELALARGDCRAATADAGRAEAALAKAFDATHPDLGRPLLVLGRCAIDLGRPRAALAPLERAITIRATRGGPPADLPAAQLALADARARAGLDGAPALAEAARQGFTALGPGQAKGAAEAEKWLAGHR